MIREVAVQLRRGSKGAHLIFMFNDGNDRRVLSRATNQIVLEHQLVGGDEVLQVNLHPNNPVYRIKYEDSPAYKDPANDKHKELARLFKGGHYQTLSVKAVRADGSYDYDDNKYLQVHQFDLIDETQNRINNIVTQKKLNRAIAIVDSLSTTQQKEILFHFNYNPTDMTASDIWSRLINFSSGVVLNRDKYDDVDTEKGKRSRSYVEYFVDEYSKNFTNEESDVFLKTLTLKALIVRKDDMRTIIERKNTGYFLGEKPLGAELVNVISFLRSNKKERDHVKEMVAKYDEVPHNDINDLLATRGIKADDKEIITEIPKHVFMEASTQQHLRHLDAARNTYRMVVPDDIDDAELVEKIATARKIWDGGKFWNIGKVLADNPNATYDEIIKIRDDIRASWKKDKQKAAETA